MIKWLPLIILAFIIGSLYLLSFMTRVTVINTAEKPQLKPCPETPNCVSSLSVEPQFKVEAFELIDQDSEKSWQRLIANIKQTAGEIVHENDRYAHAVYTSSVFRFKDDLEIILNDNHIDIRSASRAGRSDMGVNRKRIENIHSLYKQ